MFKLLKLQLLLVLLVVLVVAALVGDQLARRRAEQELARRVSASVPGASGVTASVRSFPFLGRLAVSGTVPEVQVRARRSSLGDLAVEDLVLTVRDLEVDRGEALDGRVVVRSVGGGTVDALLAEAALQSKMPAGFTVQLEPGGAVVRGPAGVQGTLAPTADGALRLEVRGRSLATIPLARSRLVPCRVATTFVQDGVRLSCAVTEVPEALLQRLSR